MAKVRSTESTRLVYSTEQGSSARRPPAAPPSAKAKPAVSMRAPADDIVRVWRQTKGRKGKGVTVITGLALTAEELAKLSGELKKLCGSGGTVKGGEIEIQGDHSDKLIEELRRRGWKVKKAGG